ncbi:MAG: hypothetical protein H6815_07720 [Phycisphaeraceae bacterium]|nr:hypothetical protein [Phycisphaeraceae bacterium]
MRGLWFLTSVVFPEILDQPSKELRRAAVASILVEMETNPINLQEDQLAVQAIRDLDMDETHLSVLGTSVNTAAVVFLLIATMKCKHLWFFAWSGGGLVQLRRHRSGRCVMCGYSLDNLPGKVCPECGTRVGTVALPMFPHFERTMILRSVLIFLPTVPWLFGISYFGHEWAGLPFRLTFPIAAFGPAVIAGFFVVFLKNNIVSIILMVLAAVLSPIFAFVLSTIFNPGWIGV